MASFKDKDGRAWPLAPITVGDFRDLKTLGLDLRTARKPEEIDRGALEAITDPEKVVNLGYWFCRAELDKAGLSDLDFAKLIDGPALQRLVDAVLENYVDFFHPGESGQPVKAKIREALHRLMEAATRHVDVRLTQALSTLTPETLDRLLTENAKSPSNAFAFN